MYEYPPILTGTAEQQLAALRDYLVRLARASNGAPIEAQQSGFDGEKAEGRSGGAAFAALDGNRGSEAERVYSAAKSLIVKTADRIDRRITETETGLREDCLALSDFGRYLEQLERSAAATARDTVESFALLERIDALGARQGETDVYLRSIRGEIRRGLITDPDSGETAMGIAIAEQLRFTGAVHEEGGLTYYELAPGQTLGLYTASGWQFWVGGQKRGWFDSADGSLHVLGQAVDDSLLLGGQWRLSGAGGFGLKYLG